MNSTNEQAYAKVVENGVQAVEAVKELQITGYLADHIFVLAHEKDRTDRIADTADAKEIGIKEEGVFDSMANLFRSRGDELGPKLFRWALLKPKLTFTRVSWIKVKYSSLLKRKIDPYSGTS